ncbi:MAG TPA: GGDEF domain-containing protein, partial [Gammaproteobacteria bacterium]|nr:GGDEF domain-containing protein [Gammaproteobacteria bacterium]
YGHAQGNALLNGIAHRLSKNCRAGEFVSRLVSDYFALMAEDVKPSSEALITERILNALEIPC